MCLRTRRRVRREYGIHVGCDRFVEVSGPPSDPAVPSPSKSLIRSINAGGGGVEEAARSTIRVGRGSGLELGERFRIGRGSYGARRGAKAAATASSSV